jgi:molybdopterin molybdotransferase
VRPFVSLITLDEARQRLEAHVRPISRTERVTLSEAANRVAAADIRSAIAVPPFTRSLMDGYAVLAADAAKASPDTPIRLRIVDRIFTGRRPGRAIVSGTCAEIATGAPLPDGTDAVVIARGDVLDGQRDSRPRRPPW